MKKNIFYFVAIFLVIFSLGVNQTFSQTTTKETTKKESKTDQQSQKDTSSKQPKEIQSFVQNKDSIQKEVFAQPIAGIKAQNGKNTIINPESAMSDPIILGLEYGAETLDEATFGDFVVEIFSTKYPNQAYGLYTIHRDPLASTTDFGTEGDLDVVEGRISFWQGTRFVKIETKKAGSNIQTMIKLGEVVSQRILALDKKTMVDPDIELAKKLPGVIRNLPEGSLRLRTAKYILGPIALKKTLGRDISQYDFYPNLGTEIAYANYEQDDGKTSLLIIEHHTPQQSIDAFRKLSQYRDSLTEEEKNKIILKRQGNYIVEADNVKAVDITKKLVEDVKYNYVVKWLDDEANLNNGRTVASEAAKTAKILISVFGLIGVGMTFALIGGVSLGFLVFYLRRRNKLVVESYSDAGGMMRLNLDGISMPILPRDEKNLLEDGK